MSNKIIIAVDAMGGENSPKKIVDGIELSLKESNENFFKLYGNKDKLNFFSNNYDNKILVKKLANYFDKFALFIEDISLNSITKGVFNFVYKE